MATSHNQRRAARDRMGATGESYRTALHAIRAGSPAPQALAFGGAAPPADWTIHVDRCRAIAALRRDRDGDGQFDEITIYDSTTGRALTTVTLPHVDASTAQLECRPFAKTSWPDLLVHRTGYKAFILCEQWWQWPDSTWRIPVEPLSHTHSVTITVVDAVTRRARVHVVEHPDTVVVDEVAKVRFSDTGPYFISVNRLLDGYGFVVDGGLYSDIAPGVQYRLARPGRLAERHWLTSANLRVLREHTSTASEGRRRTFRVGEIVTMQQSGSAGREVCRDHWATSRDAEYAHSLRAEDVEVVEILEEHSPTVAGAELDADAVTALLAPHHHGAAEAVAAWAAAGLHVSHGLFGLEIRSPGPQYRLVGRVDRDRHHRTRGQHNQPYMVVLRETLESSALDYTAVRKELPTDPIAAVGRPERTSEQDWAVAANAPVWQREDLVEDLLRRDFPDELVTEVLTDASHLPNGFERLCEAAREIAIIDPFAVSPAFAAVAAQYATPDMLDELLYSDRGAGRELADRLTRDDTAS